MSNQAFFKNSTRLTKVSFKFKAMGKQHAVVIPYPAQGHVIPLMELSHCLVNHGFKITFINTELNHKRILDSLSSEDEDQKQCPIRLISIPDGLEAEEDRNDYGKAAAAILNLMPAKLEEIIRKMNEEAAKGDGDVVTCVVADLNMGWALQVAEKMGIQNAAFYPASAALLAQALLVPGLVEDGILDEEGVPTKRHIIQLSPNMPAMDIDKLAWNCIGADLTMKKIIFKTVYHTSKVGQSLDWIICNSAYELESATFALFPKILPIGPLLASSRLGQTSGHFWPEDSTCLNWLDKQPPRSVIYVAFGSFTVFEQIQFQELASGLELSGKRFLWVVRPDSSHPYPNGFETRISTQGLIVGWAPQQNVLSHPSVACFFSHCGWNSTMEGVSNGVPFLCWPYLGDQFLNQDYICDIWKIGLRLNKNENGIISRKEIMEKITQVTEDEGIRTRVLRLMEMARESVKDEGSSSKNFKDFVDRIN